MNKIQKFEKVLGVCCWGFIALLSVSVCLAVGPDFKIDNILAPDIMVIVLMFLLSIYNLVRWKYVSNKFVYTEKVFDAFRIIEVVLVSIFIIGSYQYIEYCILIVPMIFSSLSRGRKLSFTLLGISILIKIVKGLISYFLIDGYTLSSSGLLNHLLSLAWVYIVWISLINITSAFSEQNYKNEKENQRLVVELGEKYEQLEAAQNEIQIQYDKLKESNHKLEDTNLRLTNSIAEFYTLQQISEAIGSIFDINELLKFVNDVIIGVMGVNYSTILLFDHKKNKLKVHFTNIKDKEDLAILGDNINCKFLVDILESEKPILENNVVPDKYDFIKARIIGSFICIPLSSKSRKFGLLLIEHKNQNTFNKENLRLVTTICKSVSMAIENAELYASMQVLATIDGLTGVFNRVYFHQKLESEFNTARESGYELTLVILDIDYFKKFNDTYGHLFGDVVLKSVVQTVKNSLRSTDTIARFGGEEFVIILPRTSIKRAYEKVEFLRQKIADNVITDNLVSASVTASFGIASYPETSKNLNEIIKDADNALYKAKDNGRNCIEVAKDFDFNR
ncbi:diguanylate cyclase (GGDEF)-like protein [Ruminiclostridium sufflavum DSM 19573]|uniref:Diguanylate cyclase (GGDEF)-like protein n=1 Tax=Ruminiclostridium sufflavum DSM 19573 TaxID=1121337 RepID=A0A318XMG5_9FIRM|nr:sensor domain-containing diguanylate cyclase [Ruminiclostridium sufflavum]PYG86839.1 diguanylate cyclase (GGDEF)-like protein [Ruminiclostridium sufflavum DSM 19573]